MAPRGGRKKAEGSASYAYMVSSKFTSTSSVQVRSGSLSLSLAGFPSSVPRRCGLHAASFCSFLLIHNFFSVLVIGMHQGMPR